MVCKRDQRLEAKELGENAIGTYKSEEVLVGYLPIELLKLIAFFIDTEGNHVQAVVTGKRKREVGLSVPAKFNCFTSSKSKNAYFRPAKLETGREGLDLAPVVSTF